MRWDVCPNLRTVPKYYRGARIQIHHHGGATENHHFIQERKFYKGDATVTETRLWDLQ